jgi:SNF2 family DNA or RNA helicase
VAATAVAGKMAVLSNDQLPAVPLSGRGQRASSYSLAPHGGGRRAPNIAVGGEVSRIITAVPPINADSANETADQGQVAGLTVRLLPHQIDAVRWCRWREAEGQVVRGGILADDMGLGKTITCLAVVASDDPAHGPTLVVCPASLLEQWREEIESRLDPSRHSCVVFHGSRRASCDVASLPNGTIVVTSYDTLVQAHRNSPQGGADGGDGGDGRASNGNALPMSTASSRPLSSQLHDVRWRRVLLDEGHVIRNGQTRACSACCALDADARWIVTGKRCTPTFILYFTECTGWVGV